MTLIAATSAPLDPGHQRTSHHNCTGMRLRCSRNNTTPGITMKVCATGHSLHQTTTCQGIAAGIDAKCCNVHNVACWTAVQNQQHSRSVRARSLRTDRCVDNRYRPTQSQSLTRRCPGNALWVETNDPEQSLLCSASLVFSGALVSWYAASHVVFCWMGLVMRLSGPVTVTASIHDMTIMTPQASDWGIIGVPHVGTNSHKHE